MTEKPDQEFDPSKISDFDPMEEFRERGQLQERKDGTKQISLKAETPAEKIEREERDALFIKAIKKMQIEEEEELNKPERNRY